MQLKPAKTFDTADEQNTRVLFLRDRNASEDANKQKLQIVVKMTEERCRLYIMQKLKNKCRNKINYQIRKNVEVKM